jgi:hypothetical protein
MKFFLIFILSVLATACYPTERALYRWTYDKALVGGASIVEADATAQCMTPIIIEALEKIDCMGWFTGIESVKKCAFDGSQREAVLNVYLDKAERNCSIIVDMALNYKKK